MGVKSWKEELEKERVKRKFCCVGLGYEEQPGAMQLDAWGGADVKAGRGAVAEPPVGGLEGVRDGPDRPHDHGEQKIYAGTDMKTASDVP